MEINGVAHTAVTVNNFEACKAFYDRLMPYLDLRPVFVSDKTVYYIGGRTAYAIGRADPQFADQQHNPLSVGLHHICFRARSREEIDELYEFVQELGAEIAYPPAEGPWALGYYSVSFLDPEGIRLEVNHVPGEGVFAEGTDFNPAGDY